MNKDDVLSLVGEALVQLGRDDSVYSYGVVEDGLSGGQLIYFDLPRVSSLQFNIRLDRKLNREEVIARISEAIKIRLEDADSGKTFEL